MRDFLPEDVRRRQYVIGVIADVYQKYGFEPDQAKNLFAPFRRLHSSAQFPGTGVGLSIVHRIIRRHGGRLSAQGAFGRGATFSLTVPAPSGAAQAASHGGKVDVEKLEELRCRYGQGYFVSHPMDAAALEAWVTARTRSVA